MNLPEANTIAGRIRSFGERVLAVESPLDEEQRDSGLIVPIKDDRMSFKRAVITQADVEDHRLVPGTVIYFSTETSPYRDDVVKIMGIYVVAVEAILAYEVD